MLSIKLVKSPIANNTRNRRTVQALGLRKIRQVVEHDDCPSIRGMIRKVQHMIEVTEIEHSTVAKVKVVKKATAVVAKPKVTASSKPKAEKVTKAKVAPKKSSKAPSKAEPKAKKAVKKETESE